jgi:hypothetical protein
MAVIKYKNDIGDWVPLPNPVKLVTSPTADKPVEYVEIVGTKQPQAFPDLSPYISNINQIANLVWDEAEVSGDTGVSTTNIYVPTYSNQLRQKICAFKASKSAASSALTNAIYYVTEGTGWTVGGTPDNFVKVNMKGQETALQYVGILNLYYYPEGVV